MEHPQVVFARSQVNQCRGRWAEVGVASGVSYSWLSKFARGEITNPTIDTLQSVIDACDSILGRASADAEKRIAA